jgi:hypothetical protein
MYRHASFLSRVYTAHARTSTHARDVAAEGLSDPCCIISRGCSSYQYKLTSLEQSKLMIKVSLIIDNTKDEYIKCNIPLLSDFVLQRQVTHWFCCNCY